MKNKRSKIKDQNYGINYFKTKFLTFFVLGLVLLLFGCAGKSEEPLKFVKVKRGNILATLPSTGIVLPRNRVEIKPPIAGRLDSVLVTEGQKVWTGQVLAWMSSSERATLLDAARSQGEDEYKHWQDIYKPAPIIAPLNGFIVKRDIEPGQSVTAADPILVMADRLIVEAQVDETDIGQIKLKQKVAIELDAYQGKKIPGYVSHIAYEAEEISNVTVYTVDVIPNEVPPFFRSGMSATVDFVLNEKANALLVPLKVVKKVKGQAYVFTGDQESKEIKAVKISVGLENTTDLEVLSGLADGQTLVVPTSKLTKELFPETGRRGPINPFTKKN